MTEVWVAAISALGGVAAVLVPIVITKKRHPTRNATNTSTIVDATARAVGLLRQEVEQYHKETVGLRKDLNQERIRVSAMQSEVQSMGRVLDAYKRGTDILIAQLQRLGVEPEWNPAVIIDLTKE